MIAGIILFTLLCLFIAVRYISNLSFNSKPVQTIDKTTKTTSSNIVVNSVTFISLSTGNELIPVMCRSATSLVDTMIILVITNNGPTNEVITITARIPEWSNITEKTIELRAGATERIPLHLTFRKEFYKNNELADAQIDYKLEKNGNTIWAESKPIKIASKGTMLWSSNDGHDYTTLIAAFVNPHDPKVEEIISLAKEKMKGRRLIGYQLSDTIEQERETYFEAKAMFGALGEYGLSYVNSPVDFTKGYTQRVRTPYESIIQKSANCIDGAVLYASLFENLGMEPVIVIGPGHAFVAVRCWSGSSRMVFIETTMTSQLPKEYGFFEWLSGEQPDDPFKRACNIGWETFNKWRAKEKAVLIDIKKCRELGIMPAFTE